MCHLTVLTLHVAHKISSQGSADEWLNLVSTPSIAVSVGISTCLRNMIHPRWLNFRRNQRLNPCQHFDSWRRETGSVATDFEAMYAYERGDYRQRSQLSTLPIVYTERTHILARYCHALVSPISRVGLYSVAGWYDIVSEAVGIVDPECTDRQPCVACINQLTVAVSDDSVSVKL